MRRIYLNVVIASTMFLTSQSAYSAGFLIQETNALFAQAYAGRAAAVEDGSTMFVNPAVMGYQCESQLILNKAFIIPHTKLHPTIATQTGGFPFVTTTPLIANNGGNGGRFAYVPAFYAIAYAHPNFKFGIGIVSPFGLATAYDGSSILRYTATKSNLRSVNINPAVSINDYCCFIGSYSIGVGISFQRVEADLEKMIHADFTTVGGTQSDIFSKVRGTDNGIGYNLGAIVEPCEGTRFGLAYRSRIFHKIVGFATFDKLPNFGLATGTAIQAAFNNVPVSARLKTPDLVNLSAVHEFNDQWAVLGDIMFTHWKLFKQLQIINEITKEPLTTEPERWRNTVMVSLGFNYKPRCDWLIRGGVAWDPTPTRNEFRTGRIPDQRRIWLGSGVDYNWGGCDQFVVKLAYAHLFVKKARINNIVPLQTFPVGPVSLPFLPGSQVAGKFKTHIDIIGLQFVVKL